jgi:proline dehydrogenase
MNLLERAVVAVLPAVPKRVVGRLSSRYIAGSELGDMLRVVAELNAHGKLATVDVLGEEVAIASEAEAIAAEYVAALDAFEREGLDANVSVKPTGLGLKLGYDLCKRNVETVIAAAEPTNRFVRIDMEDSSTTDDTIRLFRELRDEGHARVGPVLQASLRRTVADAEALAGASVRLCKGIYVEPESIQFRDDQEVRASFVRALEILLDGGSYAAIATHDEWLVDQSLRLLQERSLAPDRYEFQMLLGVRPELGDRIVADGHRLRIYVPYGRQWYEYSLRRLQENPKIAGYIAGDLGRSLIRRRSRLRRRWAGRDVLFIDDGRSARGSGRGGADGAALDVCGSPPEATPARPEEHRDDEAQEADDHQDHADVVDVQALGFRRHSPGEDGADGDQQDAD